MNNGGDSEKKEKYLKDSFLAHRCRVGKNSRSGKGEYRKSCCWLLVAAFGENWVCLDTLSERFGLCGKLQMAEFDQIPAFPKDRSKGSFSEKLTTKTEIIYSCLIRFPET
jgi:hypothetical protein